MQCGKWGKGQCMRQHFQCLFYSCNKTSVSFSSFIVCLFAFSFSHDVNIKRKTTSETDGFQPLIQKDYSLQTWKGIPFLILKLFIVFSSSRIWLQIHLGPVFHRKCSKLCTAKLRIRICLSWKENGIFFENKSWTLAGISLVGWVAMLQTLLHPNILSLWSQVFL